MKDEILELRNDDGEISYEWIKLNHILVSSISHVALFADINILVTDQMTNY